jgi:hypothetical protein
MSSDPSVWGVFGAVVTAPYQRSSGFLLDVERDYFGRRPEIKALGTALFSPVPPERRP